MLCVRRVQVLSCIALPLFLAGCSADGDRSGHDAVTRGVDTTVPSGGEVEVGGVTLVAAEPTVQEQCLETANFLAYPIPCPRLLPDGSQPTPVVGPLASSRFADHFIHPGYRGFSRWVFMSVDFPASNVEGHLVISGSPEKDEPRRFIYLAPVPSERVEVLGRAEFRRGESKWIYVPQSSSSIFGGHTVLVWSEGGHTYGVGFHGEGNRIRILNLAVAEHIAMVPPARE